MNLFSGYIIPDFDGHNQIGDMIKVKNEQSC